MINKIVYYLLLFLKKMKFFLIGFMGSGKTFVGKRIAKELDLPFYDLDEYIEEKEGKTHTKGRHAYDKRKHNSVNKPGEVETRYLCVRAKSPENCMAYRGRQMRMVHLVLARLE